MNDIRKIGIVGYGKMGSEIFSLFHSKFLNGVSFVILCRHSIEFYTEENIKKLAKAFRRNRISEDIFKLKSSNFKFTDNINDLADCDFIIESISEDVNAKNSIFRKIDSIVKPKCIFATNTSSIRISDVFNEINPSRKVMGMHFFYPVSLSDIIEFNDCMVQDIAKTISCSLGKNPVFLNDNYCFYINQFILYCISNGIKIKEKYNLNINHCIDIFNEIFPLHGLFGMVDSIGLKLLTAANTDFFITRIKEDIDYGCQKMQVWSEAGCCGEPGEFIKFMFDYEQDIQKKDIDREILISEFMNNITPEISIVAAECGEEIIPALENVLGFKKDVIKWKK